MKNPYTIFTRSRMGLDNGVWLSMLIVLIASIGFAGFKTITHVRCAPFEIAVAGVRQHANNIFFIGEEITFSVPAQPLDKVAWNIDGAASQKTGKIIQHTFFKEGDFVIKCILNDECDQSVTVNVIPTPAKPKPDTAAFTGDPIIGMDTTRVGDKTHYITTIKANYSYQWNAESSPEIPVQTTSGADFIFYKEGPQILVLRIDGTKTYNKVITVLPKKSSGGDKSFDEPRPMPVKIPPVISFIDPVSGGAGTLVTINGSFLSGAKSVSFGGQPAEIVSVSSTQVVAEVNSEGATGAVVVITDNGSFTFANPPFTFIAPPKPAAVTPPVTEEPAERRKIGITDTQLKKMLQQVVGNAMHAPEFDRYLCSGANTKVYVNKENSPVTLTQLCEKHLQGKKVEIESAKIIRDPENPDCESNLVVKYKKKGGILGINF